MACILYLTKDDRSDVDGGMLKLFVTEKKGNPDKIVQNLFPEGNSFPLFKVWELSYAALFYSNQKEKTEEDQEKTHLSKRLKDVKRSYGGGLSIKAHFSCLNKLGQEIKNYGSKRGVRKAYYALIKLPFSILQLKSNINDSKFFLPLFIRNKS